MQSISTRTRNLAPTQSEGGTLKVTISYPTDSVWQRVDPSDPRFIASVEVTVGTGSANGLVIRSFMTEALNSKGESLGPPELRHIISKPEQDVFDLVAVCFRGGKPHLVAIERLRPCLAARKHFHTCPIVPTSGVQLNLPGRYFVEGVRMLSLSEACQAMLKDLGLCAHGEEQVLGGAYFPFHDSGELDFSRLVEIADPYWSEAGPTSIGDKFNGRRTARLITPGQVVAGFFAGEITDLRLVLNALRVAEFYEHSVTIPGLARVRDHHWYPRSEIVIPILEKVELRRLPGDNLHICARLNPDEISSDSAHSFIHTHQCQASNRNSAEEQVGQSYPFDLVERQTTDYLGTLPHFFVGTELYVVANAGIREAHSQRNMHPHPLHTDIRPYSIEGVFEGIPNGTSVEALPLLAAQLVSRWGLTRAGVTRRIGAGTFSPGYDMGTYVFYATPINPTAIDRTKFPGSAFAVKASDVLSLAQTGEIRSQELIVGTMLLYVMYDLPLPQRVKLSGSSSDIRSLERKLARPSRSSALLVESNPALYDALLRSLPQGARILHYFDNETEGTIVDSHDPREQGLFDTTLRITSFRAIENRTHPELTLHDWGGHFAANRAIVPYTLNSDGTLTLWDEQSYVTAVTIDEANALQFSEIVIPQIVGIERYEQITKKPCIANLFSSAGIIGSEAENRAIRMMVVQGILPREISDHPDYPTHRNTILTSFLGYHVRDFQQNGPLLYREWSKFLEHARVILMCLQGVEKPGPDLFSYRVNDLVHILEYPHGRNSFKGSISDIRGAGSSRTLAQLAALAHRFCPNSDSAMPYLYDEAIEHARRFSAAYRELGELRARITDIERSQANLDIECRVREILESVYSDAETFCASHWGEGRREFPSAIVHPFFGDPMSMEKILAIESGQLEGTRNKNLCGVPFEYV